MVPPEGMRRWKVVVTCSVSLATTSWMRLDAAAVPPSTARKALVMATEILLASNGGTTVPLRLMTRSCPGAVAARGYRRVGEPAEKLNNAIYWVRAAR
jgi:hypothetical protein